MYYCVQYNPLVYFLYSRGCGRYGFGRHSPPCGRHGLILGPLLFVDVIAVAVIVCGRHGLAVIVLRVAVMDLFWGCYRLWPSWFVAVIVVPRLPHSAEPGHSYHFSISV